MAIHNNTTTNLSNIFSPQQSKNEKYSHSVSYLWQGRILLLLILLLFQTSPIYALNLDILKDKLTSEFSGKFVGYAFAIAKNGKVKRAGAQGYARIPGDGNKAMGTFTRQNVASVSKTITAIAVLQLLEANGLSIHSPIAPHLPADWSRGDGFQYSNSLTFLQLLTHKSGLKQKFSSLKKADKDAWNNDWDGLKFIVEMGTDTSALSQEEPAYKNANYALFRIIIPKLWADSLGGNFNITANTAGGLTLWYLAEKIFLPAGVSDVSCSQPEGKLHAAGYDISNVTGSGALFNTSPQGCAGHSGLRLSARNLARIATRANCANYSHVPGNEQLLSAANCFIRDWFKIGWDPDSSNPTDRHRNRFWHGGALFSDKELPRKELRSCTLKTNGNINITALTTSGSRDGQSPCSKILDALQAM